MLRAEDFSLLNEFEELFLGVVSFTDMEMRDGEKVAKTFQKCIRDSGFQDYEIFCRALCFLVDMEERLESKPDIIKETEIDNIEHFLGIRKGSLLLGEEKLSTFRLENVLQQVVPIFFGGRPGLRIGFQRQPLSAINTPQRLCYGLKKPREEIIEGAFKGRIFEDFLSNVLQGNIVIAVKPDSPIDGYLQRVDDLEKLTGGKKIVEQLKDKRVAAVWETIAGGYEYYLSESEIPVDKTHLTRPYVYLRYNYALPKNQSNCQLKITERTHPEFADFLKQQKTTEWEEDVLLLHNCEPRHCLIAQAKFTVHYSHNKYLDASRHAVATANFLRDNQPARKALNIPDDMPIVPAIFTSYTGAIHKLQDRSVKISIFFVLRDRLMGKIKSFLDNEIGQ